MIIAIWRAGGSAWVPHRPSPLFQIYDWGWEDYNSPMSNFYTRRGDDGYTGLLGEGRVPKYDPRPEAAGSVDEASAALGLARALCQHPSNAEVILTVQRDLYRLMAELSATPENAEKFRFINAERLTWLEEATDRIGAQVEMPHEFIVPGDSVAGAALAVARTVVRRAERKVAQLVHAGELENIDCLRYLNRLSSLCFVLELSENQAAGKNLPTLARQ